MIHCRDVAGAPSAGGEIHAIRLRATERESLQFKIAEADCSLALRLMESNARMGICVAHSSYDVRLVF